MSTLPVKLIRELAVSAASGLVYFLGRIYVIADDELSLWVYPDEGGGEAEIYPLLHGSLPEKKKERKKIKPDFETLVRHQSKLIAIPSGSKPNRNIAISIELNQVGKVDSVNAFSLEKIINHLIKTYAELNLEGAVICGDEIYLFQRGNGSLEQNGVVSMPLIHFLNDQPEKIKFLSASLGMLRGKGLSFTDACIGPEGKIYFLAVAEDSGTTYEDGIVSGCAMGIIDKDSGEVSSLEILALTSKPEGLDYNAEKSLFYLVTDDDDRSLPAKLYSTPGARTSGS